MEIDSLTTQATIPGKWDWVSGDWDNCVQYTPDPSQASGVLTWVEDLDSYKDERGYGAHMESTQTLTDFLHTGPLLSAPVAVVEALLAHVQAQKPAWLDPYRLQKAVVAHDLAAVKMMLTQGVQADMPVRGKTAFYCAVSSQRLAIAEAIFAAGVEVNRRYAGTDETILMILATYAPDASWEPLAQRIVAQGAELEARSRYGETPLMVAAYSGSRLPGLAGMLVAAGANVNARSQHGYTPLWKAVSHRYAPTSIVQELIAAGADVNACDNEGWTVLMEAISSSLVEAVRCLLAAGADVQAISAPTRKYEDPRSVLQFALDYANPEIIQQIQEAGGK